MARRPLVLGACMLLAAWPALAGDGHFLHGVGAVNSSMGGVATGLPVEVLGALNDNPALLTEFDDYQVAFGAEIFKDSPRATATFDNSPVAPNGSFTTDGSTQPGVLPAFGVSYHPQGADWAAGFGLLAVAGFRTDWPQDSSNPIFRPQPDGFGAVKTDLAILKIPFAAAWRPTPRLSLGLNLSLYQGALAISPLPPATPICTGATPGSGRAADCFYSPAENQVTSYAVGLQPSLFYRFGNGWSLGLSYTSPQHFRDYRWNSFDALPYLTTATGQVRNPDYGVARTIQWKLDGPQLAAAGIGWQPSPRTKVGLDVRWVDYSGDAGAGGPGGFKPDRSLDGIGWRNIWIGAIGIEHKATSKLTLRAGFNYAQTPIRSQVAFTSLGTPPTFEDHYCLGAGYNLTNHLEANFGAYYAPRHEVTGPLLSAFLVPAPQNLNQEIVPGGTFTISEQLISALVSLVFRF
ncbi:MAG TPA: outer membrane protein transport protein [Thermoanaerobaculia bacterium]|jgi:long-chain fatty acid transport protein|nr:outer membrane protein transport protein [Thermoanaerobaculia bacterium]